MIDVHKAYQNLLAQLVYKTLMDKPYGFTLNPRTGNLFTGREGLYAVSRHVDERREMVIAVGQDFSPHIAKWVDANWQELLEEGVYVGGWECDGMFYLDVTNVMHGRQRAEHTARANKQLAYYDFGRQICVEVKGVL